MIALLVGAAAIAHIVKVTWECGGCDAERRRCPLYVALPVMWIHEFRHRKD